MALDFDKLDKSTDLEGLQKDIKDAEENGGNRAEVPLGNYEVAITKLELDESKKGDPMVKCWFKIVSEGAHKGSLIFMNQVVTQGFQIHIMDDFLRSLGTDIDVKFESYKQYYNLIADIYEAVDGKLEFGLKYDKTDKGFNTFEITDIFEV